MTSCRLIKGRNANQPMNAGLGGQQTVRIFAFHSKRHSFEAGFFARLVIDNFGLETTLLCPFQIHAEQHLGPILRLSASCPWVDCADGVQLIVAAAEQHFRFRDADLVLQVFEPRAKFFQRIRIFIGKFKQHGCVSNFGIKVFLPFDLLFQDTSALQKFLRSVLIVPEVGRRCFILNPCQFLLARGNIKETSRAALPSCAALRTMFSGPVLITPRSFILHKLLTYSLRRSTTLKRKQQN